jgi:thiol-disulfide isomerase/thioredoxin
MKQILAGVGIILAVLGIGIALAVGDLSAAGAPAKGGGGGSAKESGPITTISQGDRVKIEDHLGSGLTVVEFQAEWCPGCRQLAPQVEELVKKKQGVALRRIDIKRWGSPVADQYAITSIPQLWLYDGTRLVSRDVNDVLSRLSS